MPGNSLTVILSAYNNAGFIEKCVKSLMEQSLQDIEYILIDDSSTDDTYGIICDVVSRYPDRSHQVRVIRHEQNKGLSYSRQEGINAAHGKYIIHCDGDDWVDKDYYLNLYNLAEANAADIVAGDYKIEFDGWNMDGGFSDCPDLKAFLKADKWVFLSIWNHMIRRQFIADHDISYISGIHYGGDDAFLFRCYCCSNGNKIYHGDAYYHYYKGNTSSMTIKKYTADYLHQKETAYKMMAQWLAEKGADPLDNAILREEMRTIKEGYLLTEPIDYGRWRSAFPSISEVVVNDKKLSKTYRCFWWLGQNLSSWFMKSYIKLSKKASK